MRSGDPVGWVCRRLRNVVGVAGLGVWRMAWKRG